MKKENTKLSTASYFLIAAIIVLVILAVQFFLLPLLGFGTDSEMGIVGTGRVIHYDFDAGAAFHSNDSRFFYYASRDGIRRIASNSNLDWHHAFLLNSPSVAARGDYIAVGEERGGRVIYVFDTNGMIFNITMNDPILAFFINETGFLSVIVEYGGGYGIYVFNRHLHNPENPLFRWTEFNELLAPSHVEVSPDGRYIAIAVMDLSISVRTSVQFRYLSQWDAWGTDHGLFATQDFQGQLVTALRFMSNNRLVVSTTSRVTCFQLGPGHTVSRELWTIHLDNQKTHIEFFDDTHFAIAMGDRLSLVTNEGYPLGTVRIYNMNRTQLGTFELGRRVTHLRMGHNSVLVGGGRSFHAIDFRGNSIWEHTTLFDTRDVLFLENTGTILIAGSIQSEIFERRRLREYERATFSEEE